LLDILVQIANKIGLQKKIVAAVTVSQSRCLATMEGYTHTRTDIDERDL
jgi:hypothetical protein